MGTQKSRKSTYSKRLQSGGLVQGRVQLYVWFVLTLLAVTTVCLVCVYFTSCQSTDCVSVPAVSAVWFVPALPAVSTVWFVPTLPAESNVCLCLLYRLYQLYVCAYFTG